MRINLRYAASWLLILVLLSGISLSAQAQQTLLPFQGQLTDQAGTPLTPTAPLSLAFRLYENPVGGAALWEEVHPNVVISAGRFSVLLGSRTSLPRVKMFEKTLYLGITVDDGDPLTADVEMRPRQAIVPTVFATSSGDSEKLSGRTWEDLLVSGNDPSTGFIRASKIEPKWLEQLEKRLSDIEHKLSGLGEGLRREQVVGTIVTSYLNWAEFSAATQNNGVQTSWSSSQSKWAPADGRSVPGSKFAAATGKPNVPDLRGIFLRGLNSFDPGEPSPVASARRDPDARNRGDYQGDVFAKHKHGGGDHRHKTGIWNGAATNFGGPIFRTNADDALGDPSSSIKPSGEIINNEGGDETRPKNVAIYYYIRIN